MSSYAANIITLAVENNEFRKVISTSTYSQVVVMSLAPQSSIGKEVHKGDQIIFIVAGYVKVFIENREKCSLSTGDFIHIGAGTLHDIVNATDGVVKLYTVYSPPEH